MAIKLINLPSMPKAIKVRGCSLGSPKKIIYKYEYDPAYGCPRRVKSGEMDWQDYIQESADDIDFKTIGKMLVDTRKNVAGHFTMEGEVFDVTKLPRNVQEYEALYNKMHDEFGKLPDDIKALFGSDFEQFSNAWRNGSIGAVLDAHYKSIANPTPTDTVEKTDVKKDEVKE